MAEGFFSRSANPYAFRQVAQTLAAPMPGTPIGNLRAGFANAFEASENMESWRARDRERAESIRTQEIELRQYIEETKALRAAQEKKEAEEAEERRQIGEARAYIPEGAEQEFYDVDPKQVIGRQPTQFERNAEGRAAAGEGRAIESERRARAGENRETEEHLWATEDRYADELKDRTSEASYQEIAKGLPPEEQAVFWADPAGYVTQMRQDGPSDDEKMRGRINQHLRANPELAQMGARGIEIARNIELGNIVQSQDPISGQTYFANKATGEAIRMEPLREPQEQLPGSPGAQPTIQEMASEVGIRGVLSDYWSRGMGQLTDAAVNEKKAQAKISLEGAKNVIRSAFVLGRGAVWELEQYDKLLPNEGWLESPGNAVASMRQLKYMLGVQYNHNANEMSDPGTSEQAYRELEESNIKIRLAHQMLVDVPEEPVEQQPAMNQNPSRATMGGAAHQGLRPAPAQPAAPAAQPQGTVQERIKALGYTMEDLEFTAKDEGISVEEALRQLEELGPVGAN